MTPYFSTQELVLSLLIQMLFKSGLISFPSFFLKVVIAWLLLYVIGPSDFFFDIPVNFSPCIMEESIDIVIEKLLLVITDIVP